MNSLLNKYVSTLPRLPRQPFYRKKKIVQLRFPFRRDFQQMTSILILINLACFDSRVFDRIHIVNGFYLQLKIF